MSSLDTIRGCADQALKCAGDLLAVAQLTVRVRTWDGRRVGDGDFTDSDLVLPKRYELRQITAREVSSSGGRFRFEDIVFMDIPRTYTAHGGGGYSAAQLDPARSFAAGEDNKEVIYVLTGDMTGEYTLVSLDETDTVYFPKLVLRRKR